MNEGKPQQQAIAICNSIWENRNKDLNINVNKGEIMPAEITRKTFESSVKSFDDSTLTIEHFISTEQRDRAKDVMRADGMVMDGVPSVLKQHGFDPDTGNEPIAKPVSITIGTDAGGHKGILVKTQYYDGKGLTPPDNTGQRLYEKGKDNFMPYWSIGFKGLKTEPFPDGGIDFIKWLLVEYSQVGVPENIGAKVVKSLTGDELIAKANKIFTFTIGKGDPANGGTWKFCVCKDCGHSEKHTAGEPCGKCPECGKQMQGSNTKDLNILDKIEISDELMDLIKEKGQNTIIDILNKPSALKSIAERVAQEIPWDAMRAIWFGMLDELESNDGSEKSTKAILKEMFELIIPFAQAFALATTKEPDTFTEMKNLINKQVYVDTSEAPADPPPSASVDKSKSKPGDKVVLRLAKSPRKINLPCTVEELTSIMRKQISDNVKKGFDKLRGKVS